MIEPLLVGAGGAIGASGRYLVGIRFREAQFPWATLVVNALGSGLLAAVLVSDLGLTITLFVGVGFCGALTTFSSFSYETVELWESGRRGASIANAGGNLLLSAFAFGTVWWVLMNL